MVNDWHAEITLFKNAKGALSKHIWLDPTSGKVCSDSSACLMVTGEARRVEIADIQAYAEVVNHCQRNEALALGRLRNDLPPEVRVVTADKLNGMDIGTGTIARTKEFLTFEPGTGGFVLLDFDPKAISAAAKQRLDECGGLLPALCSMLPALETAAMAVRSSTSAGLRNSETGQSFAHSGGQHIMIPVLDAADIPRFVDDLHARLWLAGFGWGMVSGAGSFLVRGLVDKACGSPERLIYEGAPTVDRPLIQDPRLAVAYDGSVLDTQLCPPLSDAEWATYEQLIAAEEQRLLPERQAVRSAWSLQHIQALIKRGVPEAEARRQVDHWIDHQELSGSFPLPFDDRTLAGATVEQVLAAPDTYVGKTLSDPFEGPSYGRGKAILYRRQDGSLFVNSFAHGGLIYDLKAAPPPSSALVYVDITREPIPERRWAVRDRIPAKNVTLLSGEGAIGKTILLLQQAAAHVLGKDWIGTMPEPGPVLFLSCEDDGDEICRRLELIAQHYQTTRRDLADQGLHVICRVGQDSVLGLPDRQDRIQATPLFKEFKTEVARLKPVAVFIDTAADTFAGNEVNRAQTRQFITLLRSLTLGNDAAVILSAHPSLSGIASDSGLSGSTAWHNSVRARMYFKKAPGEDKALRVLEVRKNNYGPEGETVLLRWKNGVYVPEPRAGSLEQLAAETKVNDLFLTLLRRYTDRGRNVSDNPSSTYAPTVFAKEPEALADKVTKKQFVEAMARLFAAKRIRVVTLGSASRQRSRIVESGAPDSGETATIIPFPADPAVSEGVSNALPTHPNTVPTPSNPPSNSGGDDLPTPSNDPANTPPIPPRALEGTPRGGDRPRSRSNAQERDTAQPDGPMKPVILPLRIGKRASRTARNVP